MRYTYEDAVCDRSVTIDEDGSYGGTFKNCQVDFVNGRAFNSHFDHCRFNMTRAEALNGSAGMGNTFNSCQFSDGPGGNIIDAAGITVAVTDEPLGGPAPQLRPTIAPFELAAAIRGANPPSSDAICKWLDQVQYRMNLISEEIATSDFKYEVSELQHSLMRIGDFLP